MAVISPGTFSAEERDFTNMLDKGGVLVGDRWFPAGSSELDRARYLVAYHGRLERNRRRRERRRAQAGEGRARNVRGPVPVDPASQRAHRALLERRKCLRRATVAPCPTANEIRTAWHFRRASATGLLRLAGLLLDLECYVDSSLAVRGVSSAPLIVARAKGLRGWIRENCPELEGRYKTLMRIKGMGRCLRQNLGLPDPVPTAFLLDPALAPAALAYRRLQVQPRGEDGTADVVRNRFAWEDAEVRADARGRLFRGNENYWLIAHGAEYCSRAAGRLEALRRDFWAIVLNGTVNRAIENYAEPHGRVASRPPAKGGGRVVLRKRSRGDAPGASKGVDLGGISWKGVGMMVLEGLEWYVTLPRRMRRPWPVIPMSELRNEW